MAWIGDLGVILAMPFRTLNMKDDWFVSSGSNHRLGLATQLKQALRSFMGALPLGWQLFQRDFAARYRESYLGYVWVFLPSVVLAFTMTLAGRAAILNVERLSVPHPLLVLIGVALWQTFSEALLAPVQALNQYKALLAKIRFPYEAMLIAKLGEIGFNALLRLLLVAGALTYFQVAPTFNILLGFVGLFALVLLGTTIGLVLAPIGGLYSDVTQALNLGLGFWMFMTPVVYEHARIGSTVEWINAINPVTHIVVFAREAFLGQALSNPVAFGAVTGISMLGFLGAWLFWRFALQFAVERAGA